MGNWKEPLTFTVNGKEVHTPEEAAAASAETEVESDDTKGPPLPTPPS